MTDGEVYAEILRLTDGKRSRRVIPDHATLFELRRWAFARGVPDADLRASLRRMIRSGQVAAGRTLNDCWIKPL